MMSMVKRIFSVSAVGVAAVAAMAAITPAAQADAKTCDVSEVCLYTTDWAGTYTTAGNVDDYTRENWVDRGDGIVWRFTKLNDKARYANNNGCTAGCGPTVVGFFRDAWGGGGRFAAIAPGQSVTMPIDSDAGASSHRWAWS